MKNKNKLISWLLIILMLSQNLVTFGNSFNVGNSKTGKTGAVDGGKTTGWSKPHYQGGYFVYVTFLSKDPLTDAGKADVFYNDVVDPAFEELTAFEKRTLVENNNLDSGVRKEALKKINRGIEKSGQVPRSNEGVFILNASLQSPMIMDYSEPAFPGGVLKEIPEAYWDPNWKAPYGSEPGKGYKFYQGKNLNVISVIGRSYNKATDTPTPPYAIGKVYESSPNQTREDVVNETIRALTNNRDDLLAYMAPHLKGDVGQFESYALYESEYDSSMMRDRLAYFSNANLTTTDESTRWNEQVKYGSLAYLIESLASHPNKEGRLADIKKFMMGKSPDLVPVIGIEFVHVAPVFDYSYASAEDLTSTRAYYRATDMYRLGIAANTTGFGTFNHEDALEKATFSKDAIKNKILEMKWYSGKEMQYSGVNQFSPLFMHTDRNSSITIPTYLASDVAGNSRWSNLQDSKVSYGTVARYWDAFVRSENIAINEDGKEATAIYYINPIAMSTTTKMLTYKLAVKPKEIKITPDATNPATASILPNTDKIEIELKLNPLPVTDPTTQQYLDSIKKELNGRTTLDFYIALERVEPTPIKAKITGDFKIVDSGFTGATGTTFLKKTITYAELEKYVKLGGTFNWTEAFDGQSAYSALPAGAADSIIRNTYVAGVFASVTMTEPTLTAQNLLTLTPTALNKRNALAEKNSLVVWTGNDDDMVISIKPPIPTTTAPKMYIKYKSPNLAFGEVKQGDRGNEEFEALAGTPTTKNMFYTAGGTNYFVEADFEVTREESVRNVLTN